MKTCDFPDCGKRPIGRGLCSGHYDQRRRGVELRPLRRRGRTVVERFWDAVDQSGECWTWKLSTRNGYGQFGITSTNIVYAHRLAYELLVGPIPEGMLIDHRCGNRSCVRPEHLRLVTYAQNSQNITVLPSNNTSGYLGVSYVARTGRWRARVHLDGVQHWAGYHATAEEAAEAARVLRNKLFTHNDRDRPAM